MNRLFVVTMFQKLKWSVTKKITFCFSLLVLLILTSSVLIFVSIVNLESNATAERHKSIALADGRSFREHVQSQLNAYSDAIYLTQQRVINSSYALQAQDSLTKLRLDEPDKLQNPQSQLFILDKSYQELTKIFVELNRNLLNQEVAEADRLWAGNLGLRNYILNSTDNYLKELELDNQLIIQDSSFSSVFTKSIAVAAGLLAIIFAVLLAWLLSAAIGQPMATIRRYLDKVSAGDYSGSLLLPNRDELGDLAQALNFNVETFRGLIESFNIGSKIEEAVKNLKTVSSRQARNANEQVSYTTQVSAAMQELSATAQAINQNADEVAEASQTTFGQVQTVINTSAEVSKTVQQLKEVVVKAGQSIELANADFGFLVEKLNDVDSHSQNSEVIVKIITELAQQIHLLALNAAIEAVGAGTYGERFAVIAREVKDLAARSSQSAGNIKTLIVATRRATQEARLQALERHENVGNLVDLGSKVEQVVEIVLSQVDTNQQAVQAILDAAEKSAYQSSQIRAAAYEQQAASEQILANIRSITEAVSVGAEGSHNVAATSVQLSLISAALTNRLAQLSLPIATAG